MSQSNLAGMGKVNFSASWRCGTLSLEDGALLAASSPGGYHQVYWDPVLLHHDDSQQRV